jgi:chromatin segregation and condensation protein Rec8/ScpA/Scc1 (kleisin family)
MFFLLMKRFNPSLWVQVQSMVSVRQLELNLELAIEEAAEVPEAVDVLSLWTQFEGDLAELVQRDRLRVAGDILVQLAGLCEAKAEVLWEDWQDAHNADGPVMGEGWLQGLTRQTQELDFSDLVKRAYHKNNALLNEDKADDDSVVGDVEKMSVLDMLDVLEDAELKSQALAVSHAENVSDWVRALAAMQTDSPQRLIDLQKQLKMPLIEVWIAALLGGFRLEQRGSFYQTQDVWVSAEKGV